MKVTKKWMAQLLERLAEEIREGKFGDDGQGIKDGYCVGDTIQNEIYEYENLDK